MSDPVVKIERPERKYVEVFGVQYPFRGPGEGTSADRQEASRIGMRIAHYANRKSPSDADMQNLVRDTRRLMKLLLPTLSEEEIKFLTLSEMGAIAKAWRETYGEAEVEAVTPNAQPGGATPPIPSQDSGNIVVTPEPAVLERPKAPESLKQRVMDGIENIEQEYPDGLSS